MSASVWRRLHVLACWPEAAGTPLRTLTRAVSFDAARVLTVSVPSERWARDLTPHLGALRDRVGELSGERIASLVLRVDGAGRDGRS